MVLVPIAQIPDLLRCKLQDDRFVPSYTSIFLVAMVTDSSKVADLLELQQAKSYSLFVTLEIANIN